ncbi:MAG: MarR family winged helix-turn-helix transcriptional regulator [Gemmatimonadaceae bacterium]
MSARAPDGSGGNGAVRVDRERSAALKALRAIVASLGRSARSVESRTGLTNGQLFLLRELADSNAMTVTALAERARARQNTVSTMLVRLVQAGFVRKASDASDARRAMLSLTPSGRRALSKAPTPPTSSLLGALRQMSDADSRALARGLGALATALGVPLTQAPLLFEGGPTGAAASSVPASHARNA